MLTRVLDLLMQPFFHLPFMPPPSALCHSKILVPGRRSVSFLSCPLIVCLFLCLRGPCTFWSSQMHWGSFIWSQNKPGRRWHNGAYYHDIFSGTCYNSSFSAGITGAHPGSAECLGITKSSRKSDLQKKGQSLTFDQLLAHRTPQTLISKLVCF